MGSLPLVSAVVATRRPAFLADAVAMVRAQTYPKVELVVVLHGTRGRELPAAARSALRAADRVLEAPAADPLGACLGRGIAASSGAVLAKIDDDDLYGPGYLEEAVAAHAAGQGDVIGKTEAYVYLQAERQLLLWRAGAGGRTQRYLLGSTLLFPRRLGERPGFRPLPLGVDLAFLDDCEALGCRFYATSRRHLVVRRMAAADHHTWRASADLFRPQGVLVRDGVSDDSPAALLRLIGAA